jgi:hypothetical protein
LGYAIVVAALGLIAWNLLVERARAKQIRRYAQSRGLVYIGAALPKSFPLSKTSLSWSSPVRNALAGDKSGKELLVFDCRLGTGKGSRSQTVVAVRGEAECFGAARFGPSLTTETVEDWTLLYRSKRILPLEEIEALLSGG